MKKIALIGFILLSLFIESYSILANEIPVGKYKCSDLDLTNVNDERTNGESVLPLKFDRKKQPNWSKKTKKNIYMNKIASI